jgi:hypothetical protein
MAQILLDDVGVRTTSVNSQDNTESMRMQWNEIDKVVAYKRDLFAFDLICLALADKNRSIELAEDMEGWDEFLDALSAHLPDMPATSAWRNKVAPPPFATNQMILFSRRT